MEYTENITSPAEIGIRIVLSAMDILILTTNFQPSFNVVMFAVNSALHNPHLAAAARPRKS